MKTWSTPLGVKLTAGGKGGPWITHTTHEMRRENSPPPLKIPLPGNMDAGWFYRDGWRLKKDG